MRLTMGFALLVMRSAIVRFLRVPGARNGAGGSAPRPDQGRAHDAMLPPRSGWTPPPAAGRAAHSGSPSTGTHLGHHIHNVPRPGFPRSLGASIVRGNPRPSFTFTDKKRACAPGLRTAPATERST